MESIALEPVDAITSRTLVDNVTDVLLADAGSAKRARLHSPPRARSWEGWIYLAAVQDAYSRRIVGWAMADAGVVDGTAPRLSGEVSGDRRV